MNNLSKTVIIAFLLAICISLQTIAQDRKPPITVKDLLSLKTRQVEQLDTFYIAGKVGSSKNFGFTNAFILCDIGHEECYTIIRSEKKSLPSPGEQVVIRVTLFTELRWNKKVFIVLTEPK